MSQELHSQAAQEPAEKRKQRKKITSIVFMLIGIGLIISGIIFLPNSKSGQVKPEDIVYDSPMHAIHEMNGASLSSIPFIPKDQPQPKIFVSEATYDFGTVGAIAVVSHEFVIQNIGEGTLTISRAYTTCGCTTADFTSTIIPPGKAAIMTLTFDAGYHDARGQTVTRGIFIENNDPNLPQLEIWTQAVVANE